MRFKLNQFVIQSEKQKIRLDTGNARFTTTDRTWAFDNITGVIDVGDGPGYASDYDLLANLPINADGFGQVASTNPFTFHIYVNNGDLKVAPQKLPFQQINGLLTLTSRNVSTAGLTAVIYDGQLSFAGMIDWSPGDGINYSGNGSLTNMTMKKLAANFTSNAADLSKASGAGDLRACFSGNTIAPSPAATLRASGDIDVRHGHFFVVPVLKNVLQKTKYADDATVGEIAAVFDISNRNINFRHVAASSPLVGVQGNGRITFDDDIDMTLSATALADWRKTVEDTDIPVFSNIFGFLAGVSQKATNVVIRDAVDQFRVTGKASDPKVEQVPVPILTNGVRSLFQVMSVAKAEDDISKELRRMRQAEAATQKSP